MESISEIIIAFANSIVQQRIDQRPDVESQLMNCVRTRQTWKKINISSYYMMTWLRIINSESPIIVTASKTHFVIVSYNVYWSRTNIQIHRTITSE